MQCFAIPFKPLGPKMTKTVSCSNTTNLRRYLSNDEFDKIVIPQDMVTPKPRKAKKEEL